MAEDTYVMPDCSRCVREEREYAEYLKTLQLLGKRKPSNQHAPEVRKVEVRMVVNTCSNDGLKATTWRPEVCKDCSDAIAYVYGGSKTMLGEFVRRYKGPGAGNSLHMIPPMRCRVSPMKNRNGHWVLKDHDATLERWNRKTESWIPERTPGTKRAGEREADAAVAHFMA